ncbi:MAG: hypothetical protein NC421_07625 [Lachnospiraceae bacterium]|nr:hypothetical protein [Lachnospiraceae bacterium]
MKHLILILIPLLALMSCRTTMPTVTTAPMILTDHDEKTVEREVITEIDTVTVFIEIPAQSAYRETPDSTSHLETDYAISDAWVNSDGTLGHTLENKLHSKPVDVPVPKTTVNNNQTEAKIKEVPVSVPQPYPVEKDISRWESFKMDSFWWLLAALAVLGCITFRKPLAKIINSFLR